MPVYRAAHITNWLTSLVLLLSSCQFDKPPASATRLVLDLDAEASVRASTLRVEVRVSSWPRGQAMAAAEALKESDFTPKDADWPLHVTLTPGAGELTRVLLFDAV